MKRNIIRYISFSIISLLLLFNTSCVNNNIPKDKISIVCTAFPQYDFVREILGDSNEKFEVTYLFENGADVHSFETDIGFNIKIKIMKSDLFIYNGGESDSWVQNILNDNSMNKNCKIISLLESIECSKLIENFHGEPNHTHDHENSEMIHEDLSLYDEHVWLSLPNAIDICQRITLEISSLNPLESEIYNDNLKNYTNKLLSLHEETKNSISQKNPYVIVADRFPFVYFFNDYNIPYEAAFSGCSSETDATYENIIKLCNAVNSNNVDSLFVLEKSNTNISSSIVSAVNKDMKIYTLNSLQSVSSEEIEKGLTYYTVMKTNIETILSSLNHSK